MALAPDLLHLLLLQGVGGWIISGKVAWGFVGGPFFEGPVEGIVALLLPVVTTFISGALVRGFVMSFVGHLPFAGGVLRGGLGVEVLVRVREVISLDVGEVRLLRREVPVIIFIPRSFVDRLLGPSASNEEARLGVGKRSGANHDGISRARGRIGLIRNC
jgi:hypothetical protein